MRPSNSMSRSGPQNRPFRNSQKWLRIPVSKAFPRPEKTVSLSSWKKLPFCCTWRTSNTFKIVLSLTWIKSYGKILASNPATQRKRHWQRNSNYSSRLRPRLHGFWRRWLSMKLRLARFVRTLKDLTCWISRRERLFRTCLSDSKRTMNTWTPHEYSFG